MINKSMQLGTYNSSLPQTIEVLLYNSQQQIFQN